MQIIFGAFRTTKSKSHLLFFIDFAQEKQQKIAGFLYIPTSNIFLHFKCSWQPTIYLPYRETNLCGFSDVINQLYQLIDTAQQWRYHIMPLCLWSFIMINAGLIGPVIGMQTGLTAKSRAWQETPGCTVCTTITWLYRHCWQPRVVCLSGPLQTCVYVHVNRHVYRYCRMIEAPVCSKAQGCSVSSRASPQRLT